MADADVTVAKLRVASLDDAVAYAREQTIPLLERGGNDASAEAVRILLVHLAARSRCVQANCDLTPVSRFVWPGHPPALTCELHLRAAQGVAHVLGFDLVVLPL